MGNVQNVFYFELSSRLTKKFRFEKFQNYTTINSNNCKIILAKSKAFRPALAMNHSNSRKVKLENICIHPYVCVHTYAHMNVCFFACFSILCCKRRNAVSFALPFQRLDLSHHKSMFWICCCEFCLLHFLFPFVCKDNIYDAAASKVVDTRISSRTSQQHMREFFHYNFRHSTQHDAAHICIHIFVNVYVHTQPIHLYT